MCGQNGSKTQPNAPQEFPQEDAKVDMSEYKKSVHQANSALWESEEIRRTKVKAMWEREEAFLEQQMSEKYRKLNYTYTAPTAEEATNTPFCSLQEVFHACVLRGLRYISEAP